MMKYSIEDFIAAAEKGDIAQLEACLFAGVDINEKGSWMEAPAMQYALQNKHQAAVEYLLQRGADLEYADNAGWTALHQAVFTGTKALVVMVLTKGACFEAESFQLAYEGNMDELNKLFEHSPQELKDVDSIGCDLIHYAAAGKQIAMLDMLVAHGASVSEKNNEGYTVLLQAAMSGHIEVVQWLLANGASVSEKDNNGQTALLLAAFHGHLEVVQCLFEKGASVLDTDSDGNTALLLATNNGQPRVVQYLLANGASVLDTDNDGDTALLLAVMGGHLELVQCLLAHGASVSEKSNNGNTALMLAARGGHLGVMRWLLANEASVS